MVSTDKSDIFLSVIENHKGIINKIANYYSKSKEDKKDLIQEIVLQLWKSFDNYNEQFKYSTWIYKVSLNVALAFSRKENNRTRVFNPLKEEIISVSTIDESDEQETNFNYLQQFVLELKELDRAIILLYFDEKTQKEIAEIVGITETNISTRIGRIKTNLRQKFSQIPQ